MLLDTMMILKHVFSWRCDKLCWTVEAAKNILNALHWFQSFRVYVASTREATLGGYSRCFQIKS